jgi:uncharacterized Tic20 family protein
MSEEMTVSRDERMMAGLAHGSVLLGLVTNGVGGIGVALLIWLTQKGKSAYVAAQALQALVYQLVTLMVTMVFWCCWGGLWLLMIMPPVIANPDAYNNAPPPGMWVGLTLTIFPLLGFMALTTLYGLWGAVRSTGGHDFKYAVIGNWLEGQGAGQ